MTIKFRTTELRDELAKRLSDIAGAMVRSGDQGDDNRIGVTPTMIDDVRTAAYVVGMAEVLEIGDLPAAALNSSEAKDR